VEIESPSECADLQYLPHDSSKQTHVSCAKKTER
jgi:hypothetical protein